MYEKHMAGAPGIAWTGRAMRRQPLYDALVDAVRAYEEAQDRHPGSTTERMAAWDALRRAAWRLDREESTDLGPGEAK